MVYVEAGQKENIEKTAASLRELFSTGRGSSSVGGVLHLMSEGTRIQAPLLGSDDSRFSGYIWKGAKLEMDNNAQVSNMGYVTSLPRLRCGGCNSPEPRCVMS